MLGKLIKPKPEKEKIKSEEVRQLRDKFKEIVSSGQNSSSPDQNAGNQPSPSATPNAAGAPPGTGSQNAVSASPANAPVMMQPQYQFVDSESVMENERVTNLVMQQIKELIQIDSNLNAKLKELETKMGRNNSSVVDMKNNVERFNERLDFIEKNLEKFMGLYEVVTNLFNPFTTEPRQQDHSMMMGIDSGQGDAAFIIQNASSTNRLASHSSQILQEQSSALSGGLAASGPFATSGQTAQARSPGNNGLGNHTSTTTPVNTDSSNTLAGVNGPSVTNQSIKTESSQASGPMQSRQQPQQKEQTIIKKVETIQRNSAKEGAQNLFAELKKKKEAEEARNAPAQKGSSSAAPPISGASNMKTHDVPAGQPPHEEKSAAASLVLQDSIENTLNPHVGHPQEKAASNLPPLSAEDVDPDLHFRLPDGSDIKSIPDLVAAIDKMDNSMFATHANSSSNDFAEWVRLVSNNDEAADTLHKITDKSVFVSTLKSMLQGPRIKAT